MTESSEIVPANHGRACPTVLSLLSASSKDITPINDADRALGDVLSRIVTDEREASV